MYKFQNINGKCEILLYSLIDGSGFEGMSAHNVIEQLKNAGDNISVIDLRINSDGGDVFEAIAMYNYLKNHRAKVNVYIDGIAASAASIVACSGKIFMPKNSMLMIHNPVGNVFGESEDMREMAAVLDKIRDNIAGIYAAKTGLSLEKCVELMNVETWISADEALNLGFADKIIEARNEKQKEEKRDWDEEIKQAVEKERARIRDIDKLNITGCSDLIYAAKYERFIDAKELAFEILTTHKATGEDTRTQSIQAKREQDANLLDQITTGIPFDIVDDSESARRYAEKINARR